MRWTCVFLILTIMLPGVVGGRDDAEVISHIRLHSLTKQQFFNVHTLGLDILELPGEAIEIFARPADLANLAAAGIKWDVIQPDMHQYYADQTPVPLPFGGFRTYSEIEAYLDSLAAANPGIMTEKFSIGLSVEGRELWMVKISDNPDIDEEEPELFYNALTHAREPAGAAALLFFIEHLVLNYGVDPDVTDLINTRELFFLPVTNPDGYVYNEETNPDGGGMWRKNRSVNGDGSFGVDLNRNFSYMWGFDDIGSSGTPSAENYRGSQGFSEPETQAVRDFILSRDIRVMHNFHCWGNLELWPPSYNRIFGSEDDFFNNLGDSLTQHNDYTADIGWTLYPSNGGANDWAWCDSAAKPSIISLTVEIGSQSDYFWPNSSRTQRLCEENIFPNLFLARMADNPFVIAPPKQPSITSPAFAEGDYQVQWQVDDDINPAVSCRLIEYRDKHQVLDDAESDNGYWQLGNMFLSADRCYSGATSWHSANNSRDYHWLVSQMPYEVKANDSLKFRLWYELEEDYDYFYAQISADGGYTFENLPCDYTTNDDPNNINLGNGITGYSGDWVYARYDLSSYEDERVIIRLSMFTDVYNVLEGVYIDDIENVEVFGDSTEISASIFETFYNFSAKPAGEYWYRVTATDGEGQESRISTYTKTVVTGTECCLLRGDCDHSGQVDVLDVDYFMDWLWREGPGLPCPGEGDVDASSQIDALDIDYLVDFLFREGPDVVQCPVE
ncbi:MAG: immune inhibitor A [Candidatus Zixiibacteriota bacterium]|nr:MAG: immune inhibitor A [candidate division Zixibacteria bacterium]